jgi:ribosomal protein L40E
MAKKPKKRPTTVVPAGYDVLVCDVARVIEEGRYATARSVNVVMTATYWLVGRRIVEEEQQGSFRARYGETLIDRSLSILRHASDAGLDGGTCSKCGPSTSPIARLCRRCLHNR